MVNTTEINPKIGILLPSESIKLISTNCFRQIIDPHTSLYYEYFPRTNTTKNIILKIPASNYQDMNHFFNDVVNSRSNYRYRDNQN